MKNTGNKKRSYSVVLKNSQQLKKEEEEFVELGKKEQSWKEEDLKSTVQNIKMFLAISSTYSHLFANLQRETV